MSKWQGYMHFLDSSLAKLDDVNTTVFRGIPDKVIIEKSYVKGTHVQFSAYTSTSSNIHKAKEFAKGQGDFKDFYFKRKKYKTLLFFSS